MKRITKLIYLALGSCLIAGLNASCELVSENYGDINTSIFPKTAEDADAITTSAAYATFKNSGYGGLFNIATGIQIVSDEAGDYGMCNWGWDHINYANWNTLKISGSGSWLTVESYAYVNDISKMTLTIDRLNDIEMDDALKQQYIAELRMGRGWLAYLLYDFYGPIPIADLETLKNPMAEKILPRLSEEEMQTYIETELTEASKVLPANYKKGDKNYGRFTAGLAHTVLLKLYMLTKQWDKAEAEGRELMKPEYGFELVPEYKDIFTLANEKNPEIIWACQCAKGYQEHKWQPHVLPNDYNFTSYLDKMTKWNGYKISWDFMQTFDPADRRLLTIAYEYTSKDGVVHNEKNDRPDPSAQLYLGAVPLKYEFDPDCTGEDSQIYWIIYRYADVLTLTAEAIVRNKNAVTQEAVDLLNEVRTRSLPGKEYSLQDLNSVDKFLKAVLDERGWELYFEGNRRQDLIRYGLFVEAIKKKAQSMGKQTLVDEDRYRFPIPQDIIDEGQGITKQNPGY